MTRWARVALVIGVFAAVLGLGKLHAAQIASPPYDFTSSTRFGWSVAYAMVIILAAYGLGLPDLTRSRKLAVLYGAVAGIGAATLISAAQILAGDVYLPRFVIGGVVLVLLPWFVLCSNLASDGDRLAVRRDRVLMIGEPTSAVAMSEELAWAPERKGSVVGSLRVEEIDSAGRTTLLLDRAAELGATVVVVEDAAQHSPQIVSQLACLHERGVRIRTSSLFYEEWLGKLPVDGLERVSLMFDIGEVHRQRYGRVKRLMDVAAGLLGMMVLLAVVPVVLVGNAAGNHGPLLFRQERVGHRGRAFTILKFRTMAPGGDSSSWTSRDDHRVTRFGRILRVSHLDELPQVVNILRGDLSIVGPRPEQIAYVEELREKLPFYDLRHLVRPGLTGWAQVKYGYSADQSGALEKLQYEFFYLRRQSLQLDLRIVVRTIRTVLGREGR